MLMLALTIISNTSFALILRAAQRRGANEVAVGMVNYVLACGAYTVIGALRQPEGAALAGRFGLVGGTFNVLIFLLLLPAMQMKGVGVAISMVRLAVVVPLGASILFWGEAPAGITVVGIALALLALPLLGFDKGVNSDRLTPRRAAVLLGLFVANGMALLMIKWFQTTGYAGARVVYLATVFAVSGIVCFITWRSTAKRPLRGDEVAWGAFLGISNAITNYLIFATLDVLPASVMFPVLAAVGLSLTTVFAAVVWREVPGRLGWAGIGVAVVAVVLTNI